MEQEKLETRWRDIAAHDPPGQEAFNFTGSGIQVGSGEVLLALDTEARRHLLIPVRDYSEVPRDTRSAGIHIVPNTFRDAPESPNFIDVVCRRPDHQDLFSIVVGDLLERLEEEAASPANVCLAVVNKWRDFFERESWPRLGPEQLIGLFAELRHLLQAARHSPAALDAWRGPSGDRHDFRRGTAALEVKATRSTSSFAFRISGHDQLEPPPDANLFLSASRVLEAPESGISVPELVGKIEEEGVEASVLWKKLAEVGYHRDHEGAYAEPLLAIDEHALYRVDDEFPRLVSSSLVGGSLPEGVSHLEYTIDLSSPTIEAATDSKEDRLHRLLAGASAQ